MSETELGSLAAEQLIEIGAHTVTHPLLAARSPDAQMREIVESKTQLEARLNRTIHGMSYPWGVYNESALHAVRAAGYEYACACGERRVVRSSHNLALARVNVSDCDGDEFSQRMEEVFA